MPLLIAVLRLLLSKSASTDSCSILFSFRSITSGALISIKFLSRLFLIIILLYKSFKSLAANRPPSSGTRGLSSGGITGRIEITIHSGLLIFLTVEISTRKDFTTFNLLRASSLFCFDLEFFKTSSISLLNSTRFILESISLKASPPIVA